MAVRTFSIFLLLALFSCKQAPKIQTTDRGFLAEKAMVVSARNEASQIGVAIMQKGGNAYDAMVATDLALAVSFPFAGNLGGGGFLVYRDANGETGTLDYREKAPKAATEDMYWDAQGNPIDSLSKDGAMAVGVPGTLAGLWELHQKKGSMPWAELVQPAIDLAKRGIAVTEKQANRFTNYRADFAKVNASEIPFMETWKAKDTMKFEALAQTLEQIKVSGKDALYAGENAQKIAAFIQKNGGIITAEDLGAYTPKWRDPIEFDYQEFKIITMGPPSSGGVVLGQILKSIEPYNPGQYAHNSSEYIQLITEAERRAYADRAHFLGDPDFVQVPLDTLLSESYLAERMNTFSLEKATPSDEVSHGEIVWSESDETTHYSIVDGFGNAVAVTTTLNGAYGSKLYDPELGFFYNNEMDDFSVKPGVPNMFGLVGGKANRIEPEKRMLSSMTPTIVEKDGKLFMVVGTPGGSTIITSVLQTILNVSLYDMGMQEAVSQPRFHHQWLPDEVRFERDMLSAELSQSLQAKGYSVVEGESVVIGKVDAILVLPDGRLEGGADPRGDDSAQGF